MEWLDRAIVAVVSFVAGLSPLLLKWFRTAKIEGRADRKISGKEQQQLFDDVRSEREETRQEMKVIRIEHQACLEKAATLTERVINLENVVQNQQKEIKALEDEVATLKAEVEK